MPVVSRAQNRWAHAAAEGEIPGKQAVGREFVDASHGMKVGKLPETVAAKKPAASGRLYRGKKGVARHG